MAQRARIGLHVSRSGGLEGLPDEAKRLGCECFQFFGRSPQGGHATVLSPTVVRTFRARARASALECYIHAPYYINLASRNPRISYGSVAVLREELQRGTLLGARYVMTHLGSAADLGKAAAVRQVIERLTSIYEPKKLGQVTTHLLLEIAAGAGNIIGDTFEELAAILRGVGRSDIGICLDTCHLFASGYDLRTSAAITSTMRAFKQHSPLTRFKLLHANDSRFALGERKDRHADIGDGQLGVATFRNLLPHPDFQGRNFILETPGDDTRNTTDVELLKKWRDDSTEKRAIIKRE